MKSSSDNKDLNRFEITSKSFYHVTLQVWELEEFLDVHPFPKFKHTVKYLINNDPLLKNLKL